MAVGFTPGFLFRGTGEEIHNQKANSHSLGLAKADAHAELAHARLHSPSDHKTIARFENMERTGQGRESQRTHEHRYLHTTILQFTERQRI